MSASCIVADPTILVSVLSVKCPLNVTVPPSLRLIGPVEKLLGVPAMVPAPVAELLNASVSPSWSSGV